MSTSTNATRATAAANSPSRLSFTSTLTMLSPMLGRYLHEYDLYSLCSVCRTIPQLIAFELEKIQQRRRVEDENEREEIRQQLAAIEAIRIANRPEIQAVHDEALQLLHYPEQSVYSDFSLTPELLTLISQLVYEKGARLHFENREMSTRGGNLCDRLKHLSTHIVIRDEDRNMFDIAQKRLACVRVGFTYLRACLLSNPSLWRNRTYIGNGGWNMLSECLFTTMRGIESSTQWRKDCMVHGEVHMEFEKFLTWLIHLLEVMHTKNGGRTIQLDFPDSPEQPPCKLKSLSLLIFWELEHHVSEKYLTFRKGSEEARRWRQIEWNLFRRADESCINPALVAIAPPILPLQQQQEEQDHLAHEARFHLSTFLTTRLDLLVILCELPHFQSRFRKHLVYAWRDNRPSNQNVGFEEIRKKWLNDFKSSKEKKEKMLNMIRRFDTAVRSGYIEEVRGKLDMWIDEKEEEEQEKKQGESISPPSATVDASLSSTSATAPIPSASSIGASISAATPSSSSSSSAPSSSHWYSLLLDPSRNSVLRHFLISIYFDLIKGKESKVLHQIHACLHPLHSAELRDPKTGLSPLRYYLTEITSMPAYRVFDELVSEAVRYHRGSVTAVLDECNASGVSIRQLLEKPRHAELRARLTESFPEKQKKEQHNEKENEVDDKRRSHRLDAFNRL